jgi:copper(I)-binding protein
MRCFKMIAMVSLFALAACGGGMGDEEAATAGELTVDNVTANLTLPTDTGALYMRIANGTTGDEALLGATVPGCETIELHEVILQDDVMTMQQVEGNRIPIPAGETVMLERGGLHVMCLGKTGEFNVGQMVPVTLQFETAGQIEVSAEVISPTEMDAEGSSMNDNSMENEEGE